MATNKNNFIVDRKGIYSFDCRQATIRVDCNQMKFIHLLYVCLQVCTAMQSLSFEFPKHTITKLSSSHHHKQNNVSKFPCDNESGSIRSSICSTNIPECIQTSWYTCRRHESFRFENVVVGNIIHMHSFNILMWFPPQRKMWRKTKKHEQWNVSEMEYLAMISLRLKQNT